MRAWSTSTSGPRCGREPRVRWARLVAAQRREQTAAPHRRHLGFFQIVMHRDLEPASEVANHERLALLEAFREIGYLELVAEADRGRVRIGREAQREQTVLAEQPTKL